MAAKIFLACLLAFSCVVRSANPLTVPSFHSDTAVSHVSFFNNSYYVASKNAIYQLDYNFEILQQLKIGPVGNEDNYVASLIVSPDIEKPVLFWCGTVNYGVCHVNYLKDLNAGDYLDTEYATDLIEEVYEDKNVQDENHLKLLELGVFGHLGSKSGTNSMFIDIQSHEFLSSITNSTHLILSSVVNIYRPEKDLPTLGLYSLKKCPENLNYFIRPTVFNPFTNSFSWLSVLHRFSHQYPIYHTSLIEHGDFIYTIAVQRRSVTYPIESSGFHTRIGRFNKTEVKFKTYIEVPITCIVNNYHYNIAIDALVGEMGSDLYSKFNTTRSDSVLYLLQGESDGSVPYSTTNSAVVCGISLGSLNAFMDKEIRRCNRGHGSLVEWHYGREKACVSRVSY